MKLTAVEKFILCYTKQQKCSYITLRDKISLAYPSLRRYHVFYRQNPLAHILLRMHQIDLIMIIQNHTSHLNDPTRLGICINCEIFNKKIKET